MIKLKVNKNEYSLITELGATFNNEKRYYEVPTNLPIIKFQKYVPLAIELLMVKSIDYNDFLDFLFTKKNLETLKTNYIKRNCNCEICGKKSHNNRVIEVWKYSMRAKIQVFDRFETVCPDCYKYKYIMDYDEV